MNKKANSINLLSQKLYWLDKLSAELPKTNLILDSRRPLNYLPRDNCLNFELPCDLSKAIAKLSKGSYFSTYWILLSALNVLLQKYTQNNDVIVGIPGCQDIGSDHFYNNIIPLRTEVNTQISFKDFLAQVKDAIIDAYNNQNCNFDKLVELLELAIIPNGSPIFDLVVLMENIHDPSSLKQLDNDLTISFSIEAENIVGKIEYKQALFNSKTIQLFAKYYTNTLKSLVENIDVQISEVCFLENEDKHQLLESFNHNTKKYPVEQTINQLFELQTLQTPNNIAVVHQSEALTYRELNQKANQLAELLRKSGLNKGEFVGIFKDRDVNFLTAILAIYKAGGAYVPIDSTYPLNRIEYMLSDSEVRFLFTDCSLLNSLEELAKSSQKLSSIICLDELTSSDRLLDNCLGANVYRQSDFSQLSPHNSEPINDSSDPAYMLYTSGSTGLPKGAIVRHDGAINHIYAQFDELELDREFSFLQSAPSSTDISVWQFLAPLLIGGRTIIVDLETVALAEKLFKVLKSEKVIVVELVPALFGGLLEYTSQLSTEERGLPDLKWMMVVGEPVSVSWVNKWLEIYPKIAIANAYGPTEAADDITQFIIDQPLPENQTTVPIGKPLANLNIYILDKSMKLLPIGAPGEICVSGIGVGDGYWKNEEKTKQAFVKNPFTSQLLSPQTHDVIYKTGDLGRWLADGNIEFLGRIDRQVKIRGFRIELGEIETFLGQHADIRENVVIANREETGNVQLIAYIVAKIDLAPSIKELRNFLKEKLPDRMIPSAFMVLESLPIAPSGKIDRQRLPKLDNLHNLGDCYAPPRNETEATLVKIWQQLLETQKIGIRDNFFELGGHSLVATRVISQIRQIFAVEMPLRSIFEHSTVAELAQKIAIAIQPDSDQKNITIEPVSRSEKLPLSFSQQRLWFLAQLEPESSFYNIPTAVRLQGKLNIKALQQSFNEIVRRHETLRTNFISEAGEPRVVIAPFQATDIPLLDLSSFAVAERSLLIQKQTEIEATQTFDLSCDCEASRRHRLISIKLLKLEAEEHIILLTMHHIVSDGWSIDILVKELATLYQAFSQGQPSPLEELAIQYIDFAVWQKQWLQKAELAAQKNYWLNQLENAAQLLELPTNYSRPAIQTFQGSSYSCKLSPELSIALNKLSRKQNSTLFMTLLAAFQILLGRYAGQEDILVGSPIANRNRAEVENLIGIFINTLVLRTQLTGDPSFETLLQQVKEVALGAYAHQDLPFELLVEQLQPERNLSHSPIFQVMFILQNAPISELELPGLTLTPIKSEEVTAQFDLTLSMTETESGFEASWEYNTDLFEESFIARMAGHFQILLEAIVANPKAHLSQLPLLSEPEQQQLLTEWNDTQVDYADRCIHFLFEEQVAKTPDALAVAFKGDRLTYGELNAKANQLAHYLQQQGVRSGIKVAICLERSLEMVIGLLAILKAGGTYIPLDPSYPQERLAYILDNSQASFLLTQSSLLTVIPSHQAQSICLDRDRELITRNSRENFGVQISTDNLAYIIYTSGSTGKPKGVQISHLALSNFLSSMQETPGLTAEDTLLAVTTYSFDIAALELFLPLIVGARLIIASRETARDGIQLLAKLQESGATVMQATPASWKMLLAAGWKGDSSLKVLCGGEALTKHLADRLLDCCGSLWNMYGPTETTIWSAVAEIKGNSNIVPIGKPIANTKLYILDRYSQLVPVGVVGELCIGGKGLARGYLNQPQLTAEKFITNPFNNESERIYKTGDLARYLPNGEIEYLGRIDNQVKLRGFRIELGEIEAVIATHPAVAENVVAIAEDLADSQSLVAYIVPHKKQLLTSFELREFLESKLPSYMIASALVVLEKLPLTPNGKVDRHALPTPTISRSEAEFIFPRNSTETTVASIYSEILKQDQIGINDNFFELGGHSLLATQVITRLREAFEIEFPLRILFEKPTVVSLAKHIDSTKGAIENISRPIVTEKPGRKKITL